MLKEYNYNILSWIVMCYFVIVINEVLVKQNMEQ